MTETIIPATAGQKRSRVGVVALSLVAGATLGITGTVLATFDDEISVRPAVVEGAPFALSSSDDDAGESSCQRISADAAERCVADRTEAACESLSADAAERCVAARGGSD